MGQAKKRGTFEQRLQAALERKPFEEQVIVNLQRKHPGIQKSEVRRFLGQRTIAMLGIALAASLSGQEQEKS